MNGAGTFIPQTTGFLPRKCDWAQSEKPARPAVEPIQDWTYE